LAPQLSLWWIGGGGAIMAGALPNKSTRQRKQKEARAVKGEGLLILYQMGEALVATNGFDAAPKKRSRTQIYGFALFRSVSVCPDWINFGVTFFTLAALGALGKY
jgi:hypothetical protein